MKMKLDDYENFDGDMGAIYAKEQTIFRVWAPSAENIVLQLFKEGEGGSPMQQEQMEKAEGGTWICYVKGDLHGMYYNYLVMIDKIARESADPYAKAAGVNGRRSMVIDLKSTDPQGFAKDCGPQLEAPTQAVICEISVRDITEHKSWGGDPAKRGKFLGVVEEGTRNSEGEPTGFDYIRKLGVTHVQIMPFFDFCSIDEADRTSRQYNWGYDPLNYNVPEGSYSSDPYHGEVRIRECKEMIAAFHRAGIGVVMDVVYNHTFDVENSCLQKCVPDYYYRKKDGVYTNGSGCGNELASERPMVRKYILDSLKYWIGEYHVDGFRFDLMGVLDIQTMRLIQKELTKINPSVLLYGEGWTGGESRLPAGRRAHKGNAKKLKGIAMFSDDFRDTVKGSVFDCNSGGFVNGMPEKGSQLRYSIVGASQHSQIDYEHYYFTQGGPWAKNPEDTVNYLSCHDNLTLWDKLQLTLPEASMEERIAVNRLAAAILFTSQGIPFFLAGEDFARSKPLADGGFSDNSYNLLPEINAMDYGRLTKYRQLHEYYTGLVAFRKSQKLLQLSGADDVQKHLWFAETEDGIVRYDLEKEEEHMIIIHNAKDIPYEFMLPEGETYDVFVDAGAAGADALYTISGQVSVQAHSSLVAVGQKKQFV